MPRKPRNLFFAKMATKTTSGSGFPLYFSSPLDVVVLVKNLQKSFWGNISAIFRVKLEKFKEFF